MNQEHEHREEGHALHRFIEEYESELDYLRIFRFPEGSTAWKKNELEKQICRYSIGVCKALLEQNKKNLVENLLLFCDTTNDFLEFYQQADIPPKVYAKAKKIFYHKRNEVFDIAQKFRCVFQNQ